MIENDNAETENSVDKETPDEASLPLNVKSANAEPEKEKDKFFTNRFVFIFLFVFGIAFTFSTLIFQVILTSTRVIGVSMKPTINANYVEGQSNLTDKHEDCDIVFCYNLNEYQNNDIVVVDNPLLENNTYKYIPYIRPSMDEPVTSIIKRVIARPGETITFFCTPMAEPVDDILDFYSYSFKLFDSNGNEKTIDQSYLAEPMYFYYPPDELDSDLSYYAKYFPRYMEMIRALKNNNEYSVTIPEKQYFVMGDNRNNSTDSRYFGMIDQEDIVGKVVLQVKYGKTLIGAIWEALTSNKILPERKIYEK